MSPVILLAPVYVGLLAILLTPTTIATPAPVPAPINGDPCGPVVQDNPNYPNTCSVAPALVDSPQPYGINCTTTAEVTGYQTIAWQNCTASYENICTKALDSRTRKGVWIWSELAEQCALGIFLPPYQGAAQLQNFTRCVEIFTALNNTCSTVVPASNFGGINLRAIPGIPPSSIVDGKPVYDGSSHMDPYHFYNGEAINVGYPSYIIAFLPLVNPLSQ